MSIQPSRPCPGCGAVLADIDGPVHPYMESTAGCWAAYGEVLAREYSTPEIMVVHRLTVDAYGVQHPGGGSRQAIQSVGLHLVRLCMILERALSDSNANAAMLRAAKIKASMTRLSRPSVIGSLTVSDVLAAEDAQSHRACVRGWARSTWEAWSLHHDTVRRWADMA